MNDLPAPPTEYIWQEQFWAALMEPNTVPMREHIRKARVVMNKRLEVLAIYKHAPAMLEYKAIQDAEVLLKTLERNQTNG